MLKYFKLNDTKKQKYNNEQHNSKKNVKKNVKNYVKNPLLKLVYIYL